VFKISDVLEVFFAKIGVDLCSEVDRFQIGFLEGAICRETFSCKGEITSSCWKWFSVLITTTKEQQQIRRTDTPYRANNTIVVMSSREEELLKEGRDIKIM